MTCCPTSVTKYPYSPPADQSFCTLFPPYEEKEECGDCIEYSPEDGHFQLCINNLMHVAIALMPTKDHPITGREKVNPTWEVKTLSRIIQELRA